MVALGLEFYLKQRKIDKEKASRYKENLSQTTRRSPIGAQTKLDIDRNVKNQLNLVCHEHGNTSFWL